MKSVGLHQTSVRSKAHTWKALYVEHGSASSTETSPSSKAELLNSLGARSRVSAFFFHTDAKERFITEQRQFFDFYMYPPCFF